MTKWWLQVDPSQPVGHRRRSLIGYIERYQLAADLFDHDDVATRTWLEAPNKALGGRTPLESNVADVRDLIGRLTHGVIT